MSSIKKFCELVSGNLADFTFEHKRLALDVINIKVWVEGEDINIEGAIPTGEVRLCPVYHCKMALLWAYAEDAVTWENEDRIKRGKSIYTPEEYAERAIGI